MDDNKSLIVNKIIKILSQSKDINAWKIVDEIINGDELFFVYKKTDMIRSKLVHNISVTVYKDFEQEGKKFRGSASMSIHPTMEDDEIEKNINDASFAAGFVTNEYYELVKPENMKYTDSEVKNVEDHDKILNSVNGLYKSDKSQNGRINSAEFFVKTISKRIINSEGIDVNYETTKGEAEFITSWKETGEEVELYKAMKFKTFDEEYFSQKAEEMLNISRERAVAVQAPALTNTPIMLTGEPVEELFKYYYNSSEVSSIYNKVSTFTVGKSVQGDSVKGDLINIELDPFMEGSPDCEPNDEDGVKLGKVKIIENGILKNYWGDARHSYYLGVKPTGIISNMRISGGTKTVAELKQEPYIEIVAFSDFRMDAITGNFGGEIRLGWYFDGKVTIPVTGGSISGNIKNYHNNFYLSKEVQKNGNFIGPKTIKLYGVSIAGKSNEN